MSKIGIAEVRRIAALAHIGLSDEEAASISAELGQIMEFVEALGSVKTDDVPPTDQVTGLVDVLRPDQVKPSPISQATLLQNAPEREGGYIKVRRVL